MGRAGEVVVPIAIHTMTRPHTRPADKSYQPPGGEAGRIGDRAVLHRVAHATVKDFADRVGAMLSNSDEASGGPSS
jgi:hypothetical protein